MSLALSSRASLTSAPIRLQYNQQKMTTASRVSATPRRQVTRMGNKGDGGIFAPLVVVTRNVVGTKDFNKLRGQAISLHSQVIKEFGNQLGADIRQIQGVIRLAKKNGEWLGFLA